jgi:hypothetical protein
MQVLQLVDSLIAGEVVANENLLQPVATLSNSADVLEDTLVCQEVEAKTQNFQAALRVGS